MKNRLWLASCLVCVSLPCLAGESGLFKRLSVDYRNIPLADVIKDLAEKSGVQLAVGDGALPNQDNVFHIAKDQEAGRILTEILRPRRLALEIKSGQTSVVKSSALNEFRLKPEQVFEFAEKPKVLRNGKTITITFETKAFCDVTVAMESPDGTILRHFASGVLGENAPEPFQWNSKKQTLVWDAKNDKGEYVDDLDSVVVRVSLGLKAGYEKPLFWSPHKRFGAYAPVMSSTPEGVYVAEGFTTDTVRLFDHDGKYVKTIFPFPAGKLNDVIGLGMHTALQTGQSVPHKLGMQQAALLTSGNSCLPEYHLKFGGGIAATTMAVHGDRIALAFLKLNRLKTDGSTGGLPLEGPATGFLVPKGTLPYQEIPLELGPSSAAFSPDGKMLYLTGFTLVNWHGYSRQGVYKISYEKDQPPELFAGNMDANGDGTDDMHFAIPNSVACDAKGRVYVADYLNNRVQVFDPEGKFLKTIPTPYPAKVQIDPRNQQIYVFSWFIATGISNDLMRKYKIQDMDTFSKLKPTLSVMGSFDDPKLVSKCELPLQMVGMGQQQSWMGQLLHVEMDFWAKQPTLWLVGRRFQTNLAQIGHTGNFSVRPDDESNTGIQLFVRDGDGWKRQFSFGEQALKDVARLKPPEFGIQRLAANQKTHKMYLLEHLGFAKKHHTLIEIDPETAKCRAVPIPIEAEDVCFDGDGLAYLRNSYEVVRYDPETWREVPWDYGEERESLKVLSALPNPGTRSGCYHQGGMWVSPMGHLAVHCFNNEAASQKAEFGGGPNSWVTNKPYTPQLFPGRLRLAEIHVWDRHGKLIREDAVPGLGTCDGLGIDRDDNIYAMFRAPRNFDDKPYPPHWIWEGTMIKFKAREVEPQAVKVVTESGLKGDGYGVPLPLSAADLPKRPPDTLMGGDYGSLHGKTWMSGAQWFYGGCGVVGASCSCYHTRFSFDSYFRSFAPEPDLFSVAVLDSNGNLITHIGKYGSTDDGAALVPDPRITAPHPIGGDEVPLFYPAYVAVDTDRRLFASDIGNARIVSAKLSYHTEEKIALNVK